MPSSLMIWPDNPGLSIMVAASLNAFYYINYADWFAIVAAGSLAGLVVFYTWFSISLGLNYRKLMAD